MSWTPFFHDNYLIRFGRFVCIPFSCSHKLQKKKMSNKEEHIRELKRLMDLSTVPSVQKVLEDLINENREMREPIKRSKVLILRMVPMKMLNSVLYRHKYKQSISPLASLGTKPQHPSCMCKLLC